MKYRPCKPWSNPCALVPLFLNACHWPCDRRAYQACGMERETIRRHQLQHTDITVNRVSKPVISPYNNCMSLGRYFTSTMATQKFFFYWSLPGFNNCLNIIRHVGFVGVFASQILEHMLWTQENIAGLQHLKEPGISNYVQKPLFTVLLVSGVPRVIQTPKICKGINRWQF